MTLEGKLIDNNRAAQPNPANVEKGLGAPASEKLGRAPMLLLLTAASMLVLFLPMFLLVTATDQDAKNMNNDLAFIRTSLTQVPTPIPAIQKLMTPIAQTQAQISQLNVAYPTLVAPRIDWITITNAIGNYDPKQIALNSITRTTTSLIITGRAASENSVTNYARALEQSDAFSRVVIQSVNAVAITATVTPITKSLAVSVTPTAIISSEVVLPTRTPFPYSVVFPTPGSVVSQPVVAATPDLRDVYEPDANQPKPINMGQAQSHNFYPEGDVDAVTFLAKMGRYYHIFTTALAPGVDTVLYAQSGALAFTNDDAFPGSLYSDLRFQNAGPDTWATVLITNRGTYGADKTYSIVVEEYLPTPTPIPTNTPLATATNTRQPTATRTPTITPTPDFRDRYEPDDVTPKAIFLGDTQQHNFYPNGDIDKVSFPVKTGRYYQALTAGLALGVDTIVTVVVGNQQWVNDDYAPGTGNFASAVCFRSPQDGTAIATIINSAQQYGADKAYQIKVSEVSSLSASPCIAPTVTPTATVSSGLLYSAPRAVLLTWRAPDRNSTMPRSSAPLLAFDFVIVADLKVK